jgi:hypothetical protein
MNAPIPPHQKKESPWRAGILRVAIGAVLIVVSTWGISLCRGIFRAYVGPGSLPGDSLFASLGAWATWGLFFAPLGIGGVAMVWSALRKMGGLDHFASWLGDRAGHPESYLAKSIQWGAVGRSSESGDPLGLENLSAETVERLQRSAARAATILGALAGASLLGIGIFGLGYLLLFSWPSASSSIYVPLATSRVTISFAVFSGMLVFVGITILQQTFRREDNSWLFLLRVFTFTMFRRGQVTVRSRGQQQNLPGTKHHPKV